MRNYRKRKAQEKAQENKTPQACTSTDPTPTPYIYIHIYIIIITPMNIIKFKR
jgi:hypothetical protein